jgi:hypothetical protein
MLGRNEKDLDVRLTFLLISIKHLLGFDLHRSLLRKLT